MCSSPDAGYSGTPLPTKLGVKPGSRVLLDGAPDGFDLGPLPADVVLHARPGSTTYDVGVLFCPDVARLVRRWPGLAFVVRLSDRQQVAAAGARSEIR